MSEWKVGEWVWCEFIVLSFCGFHASSIKLVQVNFTAGLSSTMSEFTLYKVS